MTTAATGPTVKSVFARIDTNNDGAATKAEVKKMVEAAKVGGGIFGGIKVNLATDAFMSNLDANSDGKIGMDEVMTKLTSFVGGSGSAPQPGDIPRKALEWFDTTDANHDGKLSQSETKAVIQKALEDAGQDMADTKAEIAAKIGVYLVDENHDGSINRAEVQALAEDVEKQTVPAPAPAVV